jgi:hypothetical protein
MKTTLSISVVALLLAIAPSRCFASWLIADVSKKQAKEMGMEVRSKPAGPHDVRVELEFKIEGKLKEFSRVELRIRDGKKSVVTAALREDRSKPERVVVSFSADRTRLDKITLWVMVPFALGGTAYELRVKDFVELKLKKSE